MRSKMAQNITLIETTKKAKDLLKQFGIHTWKVRKDDFMCSVVVSHDGTTCVTLSDGNKLEVYDIITKSKIREIEVKVSSHNEMLKGILAISRSGFLATFSNCNLMVFNIETGEKKIEWEVKYLCGNVEFSPDGSMLACACAGESMHSPGTTILYDIKSSKKMHVIRLDSAPQVVAFSANGAMLAIGEGYIEGSGKSTVYRLQTRTKIVFEHDARVSSVAFSQDSSIFAVGVVGWNNHHVTLYNLISKTKIHTFQEGACICSFSPNGATKL
eukprot:g8744.t1